MMYGQPSIKLCGHVTLSLCWISLQFNSGIQEYVATETSTEVQLNLTLYKNFVIQCQCYIENEGRISVQCDARGIAAILRANTSVYLITVRYSTVATVGTV
jgi:hypothetical protein